MEPENFRNKIKENEFGGKREKRWRAGRKHKSQKNKCQFWNFIFYFKFPQKLCDFRTKEFRQKYLLSFLLWASMLSFLLWASVPPFLLWASMLSFLLWASKNLSLTMGFHTSIPKKVGNKNFGMNYGLPKIVIEVMQIF